MLLSRSQVYFIFIITLLLHQLMANTFYLFVSSATFFGTDLRVCRCFSFKLFHPWCLKLKALMKHSSLLHKGVISSTMQTCNTVLILILSNSVLKKRNKYKISFTVARKELLIFNQNAIVKVTSVFHQIIICILTLLLHWLMANAFNLLVSSPTSFSVMT
jgi:hypothetical protein